MSRFTERCIFKLLLTEAAIEGYEPVYIGYPGDTDGVDVAGSTGRATEEVFAVDDADVTFALIGASPVEYRNGKPYYEGFWVRLIGGNGEDFISDYGDCEQARKIMERVYKEINS